MAGLQDIVKFYRFANKQRDEFYNVKWRLVVAALVLLAMWLVSQHLSQAYPPLSSNLLSSALSGTSLQASERMFNWFITGFLLGFVAFALMAEGEFFIASSKLAHKLAEDLGLAKRGRKNPTRGKLPEKKRRR